MRMQFLQEQLTAYLALRESLGHINKSHRRQLQSLIEYADQHSDSSTLRAQITIDWACGTGGTRGASTQFAMLSLARGFLTFLKATYPETEVPDRNLIGTLRRPNPYIFSDSEVHRLLRVVSELSTATKNSDHAEWYRTCECVIGLLACTGLRIKEALNLSISDVRLDATPPCVLVRESKFKKSRWVPLHPTAAERLRIYSRRRHRSGREDASPFFISIEGKRIGYSGIYRTFRRLLRRAEITSAENQTPPSFHGLRHTFAVNRLRTWYESGADPRLLAPHLSVYMGHVNMAATYWYISATPELLTGASKLFESYSQEGGAR